MSACVTSRGAFGFVLPASPGPAGGPRPRGILQGLLQRASALFPRVGDHIRIPKATVTRGPEGPSKPHAHRKAPQGEDV